MKNKAIITLLFLLILASLACTSADYAAAFHIDYEPSPVPFPAEAQLEATVPSIATASATALPSMQVCTGVENGVLRVRNTPGTSGALVATLSEGQRVYLADALEAQTDDGATWRKITDPEGWINGRFLCEE